MATSMTSSILTPHLEQVLLQIIKGLNTSNLVINNMYNGKYVYTLNRYKDMLLESTKHLNIEKSIIESFLLKIINAEYAPDIATRIKEIEAIPLIEQKTPEWFKQRETMISASDSGYFLKKCGASKAIDSLKIKVGLKSYVNSSAPPLTHGNTYEDVSRAIYESRNCVSVTEYGILSSPTTCIGASPDGVVTSCHKDTYDCKSKYGRLLEIKNPYSREIDNTIKPEYMVQILQQQYTTGLPICDFVETTIVDAYCNTNNSNYKPYTNLAEMLDDKLDKTNLLWEKRVKNKNIPIENLNKFGNEKGLIVWYKKQMTETDTRNKYIMYPLMSVYDTLTIEKWIVDTTSEQFKDGYRYICTKYWRLDVYSEKTVVYDQTKFEGEYVPQLCSIWEVITNCNELSLDGGNVANYIEDIEKDKESPFYNENKRKKKAKMEEMGEMGGMERDEASGNISPTKSKPKSNKNNNADKEIIELDF